MVKKYTFAEMRKKNEAAGHYWFQGMSRTYREAYNIISQRTYYDGHDNYICVKYKSGRRNWYYFNPDNGHIVPIHSEKVPEKIREKA
jgi:glucan-binding YG repeat protein